MHKYMIQDASYEHIGRDRLHAAIPVDLSRRVNLLADGHIIATFHSSINNRTNAQKVCDLLNETSCSQGKF